MSVDREYKIRISTVTEGDAGKTVDDLKKVGKAAEEGGEGMKFFEFHGKEFNKLLHALDQTMPGVSVAIKALFNPATLGLGAALLIFERLKESLAEYNQKLDEAGEAAAKADFAASIEAALEATRDAVAEQEKYIANLNEIKKGEHGVAVELNNQLQLIAAIEAARQQKAEAEKTLALAKIQEQQIFGAITPSQAAIAKETIEEKYVREKRGAEERKFREEQDARLDAAQNANARQEDFDRKQLEAANALAAAKRKQQSDIAGIPDEERLKRAATNAEAFRGEAIRIRTQFEGRDILAHPEQFDPLFVKAAQDAEDAAKAAEGAFQNLLKFKKAGEEAKKLDLTPLQIASEQAKKEAEANAQAAAKNRADANRSQIEHDRTQPINEAADRTAIANLRTELRGELQKIRAESGKSIEDIFMEGLQGMQTLQNFKDRGLNQNTIIEQGEAAKRKRDEGRFPLTGFDQNAIANEDALVHAREQIAAQNQLLTAMGQNAAAVQQGFAQMVQMHNTNLAFQQAVNHELALIHQQMRNMQSSIPRVSTTGQ